MGRRSRYGWRHDALTAAGSGAVALTAGLVGAGGFGKTMLAAPVCQDLAVQRRVRWRHRLCLGRPAAFRPRTGTPGHGSADPGTGRDGVRAFAGYQPVAAGRKSHVVKPLRRQWAVGLHGFVNSPLNFVILRLWSHGPGLVIEVRDRDPTPPVPGGEPADPQTEIRMSVLAC